VEPGKYRPWLFDGHEPYRAFFAAVYFLDEESASWDRYRLGIVLPSIFHIFLLY
jgi:hypothetical protein